MKIFVCVKQVPDTRGKVYLKKDGSLDRARMTTVINPDDLSAVELALRIKDETGAKVTAITMGPPMAAVMLHELYAMGVDETVLVTARELVGSDTYGTSSVLAAVIRSIGLNKEDIILCGRQAIDGDTAQVGPEMAEKLGIAQITYVSEATLSDGAVLCKRTIEDGYIKVRANTPCLLTCMQETGIPRYMHIDRILSWDEKRDMRIIGYDEIKDMELFEPEVMGTKNSPTIILTSFALQKKTGGVLLDGSPKESVRELFEIIENNQVMG